MKLRIGIFDSGIGGFTVLKPLLSMNHKFEILYLADIKRNPYGDRSFQEIREIAFEICSWFKDKSLDALLIACNTTNACALDIVENELEIPCFDLINSASQIVLSNKVGILATPATVNSSFYKNSLESLNKGIIVYQQACPEFVPELEKIYLNKAKLNYLAEIYSNSLIKKNIGELILGCSHYPLIYEIIRRNIPKNVKIIDPSVELINNFKKYFKINRNSSYLELSYDGVEFFATANIEEFSLKVINWLEINKKISFVNLRTNT